MSERGALLWSEDDVTVSDPLHETLAAAYLRITGRALFRGEALRREDHGDGELLEMPSGYIVWSSYPGNGAIYEGAKT
jgi:hypothetical protein